MRNRFEALVPIGLALTLGFGLLQAQPAAQVGRETDIPSVPAVLKEPGSLAGMNLDFTRGTKLGEVFLNLSKQSGVGIVLHASVSGEASTSADLRGMTFLRALDTLMLQNDLFYTVMDPVSIMVFKNTPQNRQDHETRLIRTFYLANADEGVVRQTLGTLMPGLRVYTDKRLNAVTLSGTPGELAKAQQVVNSLDLDTGEVWLQMQLIEVPGKASAAAGLLPPGQGATAVAPDGALARLVQDGESNLLASPMVRVAGGASTELWIGRKPSTTQVDGGARTTRKVTTGKADDAPQAAQGDDLGVKIKARPKLLANHEIALELACESTDSPKAGEPGLGKWVLKTSVRIKDGESAVFGCLLGDGKRDDTPDGAHGGKKTKDRLLVVKAVVVRPAEPQGER